MQNIDFNHLAFQDTSSWNSSFFLEEEGYPALFKAYEEAVLGHTSSNWVETFPSLLEKKVYELIPVDSFSRKLSRWREKIEKSISQYDHLDKGEKELLTAAKINGIILQTYFRAERYAETSFFPEEDRTTLLNGGGSFEIVINNNLKIVHSPEQNRLQIIEDDIVRSEFFLGEEYADSENEMPLISITEDGIEYEGGNVTFPIGNRGKSKVVFQSFRDYDRFTDLLIENKKISWRITENKIEISIADLSQNRGFLQRTKELLEENHLNGIDEPINWRFLKESEKEDEDLGSQDQLSFLELCSFFFHKELRKNYLHSIEGSEIAYRLFMLAIKEDNELFYQKAKEKFASLLANDRNFIHSFLKDSDRSDMLDYPEISLVETLERFVENNPEKIFDFLQMDLGSFTLWEKLGEYSILEALLISAKELEDEELASLLEDRFLTFQELLQFSFYCFNMLPDFLISSLKSCLLPEEVEAGDFRIWENRYSLYKIIKISYQHSWARFAKMAVSFALRVLSLPAFCIQTFFSITYILVKFLFHVLDQIITFIVTLPEHLYRSLEYAINQCFEGIQSCFAFLLESVTE